MFALTHQSLNALAAFHQPLNPFAVYHDEATAREHARTQRGAFWLVSVDERGMQAIRYYDNKETK